MNQIERMVLIDILRNTGTTRDQVRYRLTGQSPVIINRAIERLIQNGEICYISNRLEITGLGRKNLQFAGVPA